MDDLSEWINLPLLLGLIVVNVPLYLLLGKAFFEDWRGFLDAVYYWFKPDWMSWMEGEYAEDFFAEMKLFVFFLLCVGAVASEYAIITRLF